MEDTVNHLTRQFVLLKQSAAWRREIAQSGNEVEAQRAASEAGQAALLSCRSKFTAFLDHFQPIVPGAQPISGCEEEDGAARVSQTAAKRQHVGSGQGRKRSREECFKDATDALSSQGGQDFAGKSQNIGRVESETHIEAAGDCLVPSDQALLRTIGEREAFFVVLDTSLPCLPIARTSPACEEWTGARTHCAFFIDLVLISHFAGRSAQQLQGQRLYILHGECANPVTLQLIQAACTPGRYAPLLSVLRMRNTAGHGVPAILFVAPMTTVNGAVPMVVCVYRQTSEVALQEWEATSLPTLAASVGAAVPQPAAAGSVYSDFQNFAQRHMSERASQASMNQAHSAPQHHASSAPAMPAAGCSQSSGLDPQARPFLQGRVSKFKLSAGRRGQEVAAGSHGIHWPGSDGGSQMGLTGGTTMSLSTAVSGSTFGSQKQSSTPIPPSIPVTSTPLSGLGFVQHAQGPTFAAHGFQIDTQYKPNIKSVQYRGARTAGSIANHSLRSSAEFSFEQPVAIGKVGSNFTVGFRERDSDGSIAGGGVGSQNPGGAPPVGPRSSASAALGPIGDGVLTADTQPEDSAFHAASINGQQQHFVEELSLAPLLQDMYPEYAQPSKRSFTASAAAVAFGDMSDLEGSSN